jgi:hypothetical protein
MGDEYIMKMQIVSTENKNGVDVPNKVMLVESKTALEEANPMQAMTRNKMLDSLYEALDYGNAWLNSHNICV